MGQGGFDGVQERSLANQMWAEVSMRGEPCSPNHQKGSAPKTATHLPAAAAVPYGSRTSVQTMG